MFSLQNVLHPAYAMFFICLQEVSLKDTLKPTFLTHLNVVTNPTAYIYRILQALSYRT